jgi:hypothetical protein
MLLQMAFKHGASEAPDLDGETKAGANRFGAVGYCA